MFVYRRGVRIVDEEIDLKKIKAGYEVDDDYVPTQEELPQVVGILDERSDEVRARQDYWENPSGSLSLLDAQNLPRLRPSSQR